MKQTQETTGIKRNYTLLEVNKRTYVLTTAKDRTQGINKGIILKDANFMGTGKALCGVLRPNETLLDWIHRKSLLASKNSKKQAKNG